MKNKMKEYEKFIKKEIKEGNRSEELLLFHEEMVRCFQHERLIHLIIMLFFVFVSLVLIFFTIILLSNLGGEWFVMWPCYLVTLIVTALAVAYVKYYYFLENHVQALYRITAVLAGYKEK